MKRSDLETVGWIADDAASLAAVYVSLSGPLFQFVKSFFAFGETHFRMIVEEFRELPVHSLSRLNLLTKSLCLRGDTRVAFNHRKREICGGQDDMPLVLAHRNV